MTERHKDEVEAYAALGELSVWVSALSEDANADELQGLGRALSDEVDRFLATTDKPVPLSARSALHALEQPSPPGTLG
jgi:hypothetical protein